MRKINQTLGYFSFNEGRLSNVNFRLCSLQRFSQVCRGWEDIVLSSTKLYPIYQSAMFYNEETYDEVKLLTKCGYFNRVKSVFIEDPNALHLIRSNIDSTALEEFHLWIRPNWKAEHFEIILDIMKNLPKVYHIAINIELYCQELAITMMRLILEAIHCNSRRKEIIICPHWAASQHIDWSFFANLNFAGIGTIDNLIFDLSHSSTKTGPDWSCLTKAVPVAMVTFKFFDEKSMNNFQRFLTKFEVECVHIITSQLGPVSFPFTNRILSWLRRFQHLLITASVTVFLELVQLEFSGLIDFLTK